MPNINEFTDRLLGGARDALDDTISYKAAEAASYAPLLAFVEIGADLAEFGNASVVTDTTTVAVLQADVPAKPNRDCRLKIPALPGLIFAPVNVLADGDGFDWKFDLEAVPE